VQANSVLLVKVILELDLLILEARRLHFLERSSLFAIYPPMETTSFPYVTNLFKKPYST